MFSPSDHVRRLANFRFFINSEAGFNSCLPDVYHRLVISNGLSNDNINCDIDALILCLRGLTGLRDPGLSLKVHFYAVFDSL